MYLEECPRLQSQSQLWFEHRVGRITASKFAAVSRASVDPPPSCLIKQLIETSQSLCHVPAIQWGVDHEDVARTAYLELTDQNHISLKYSATGLHLNPSFPHLGASPDGLINCECYGTGIIEIKCPFKHRDKSPQDVQDPHFTYSQMKRGNCTFHITMSTIARCKDSCQSMKRITVTSCVGPQRVST